MADTLDKMLEPDEEVLYRRLRPWVPRHWRLGLAAAAVFGAFALLAVGGFVPLAPQFRLAILLPTVFVIIGIMRASMWEQALEMAVTERRVLSITNWAGPVFQEIRLDCIAAVVIARHSVLITTRDGEEIRLGHPYHAAELGRVIAQAAGLAPPALPQKAESVAERFVILIWLLAWTGGFHVGLTIIHGGTGLATKVLLVIALLIGAVVVFLIGELLFLTLLRPLFTWSEMRAWIARTELLSVDPGSRRRNEWHRGQLLRFVDLLYGQPKNGRSEGTAGHG